MKSMPILSVFSLLVLISLSPGIVAEGFGLSGGPFYVQIETDEPEQDFVVVITNYETAPTHGPGLAGGAYRKISHGPSGTPIYFPRDWLYSWTLSGKSFVHGYVLHPKYERIGFSAGPAGKNGSGVLVGVEDTGSRSYLVPNGEKIIISVKPIPFDKNMKKIEEKSEGWTKYISHTVSKIYWDELESIDRKRRTQRGMWRRHLVEAAKYFDYFSRIGEIDEILTKYMPYLANQQKMYFDQAEVLKDYLLRMRQRDYKPEEMSWGDNYYDIVKQN